MQRPLRLWVLPWGLYPRRVTIYLAEKGIQDQVEIIPVNITQTGMEAAPGKPPGTMPILEIRRPSEPDGSDGQYIFQSTAILEYLEDIYGPESHPASPNMRGATPEQRGKTRECMDVLNEGVSFFSFYVHNGSKLFVGMEEQSDEAARMGMGRMNKMFDLLESMASENGPWVVGTAERPLIVDCVLMATLQFAWHVYGVGLCDERPRLRRVYEAFRKRESARLVEAPEMIRELGCQMRVK